MSLRFVTLNGKVRTSKTSYMIDDLSGGMIKGNLGVLIPKDCVVIDIDSTSPSTSFYIEWLRAKYPNIFITKTPKVGGYHVWFKTDKKVKRDTGLQSIFGWRFDILTGTSNYITLPDNYEGRRYVNGFKNINELSEGWEEYDVRLPENIFDLMPFVDATPDHRNPLEFGVGERNAGLIEWLGYFVAKGISVDCIKKHTRVLCSITNISEHELTTTVLSSLAKYENRDTVARVERGIPTIKQIVGDDYVSISLQLCEFIKENDLFGFDEATGLGYCNIASSKGQQLTQKEMRDKMILYFGDKLFYAVRDKNGVVKKLSKLPTGDRDVIFEEAKQYVKFNSREQQYKDIPAWDGKERINTFLKEYYDCDANPNFLWLLLTSLIGKLHDPEHTHVPYFFDFVGEQGCVRGNTLISIKESSGQTRRKTIKTLLRWQEEGRQFLIRSMNEETGRIEYVKGMVVYKGKNKTYTVKFDDGNKVIATADHKFYTKDGWKQLQDLTDNDYVLTGDTIRERRGRNHDKEFFVKFHPDASVKIIKDTKTGAIYEYFRLKYYRAVYEANMNGMTVDEYVYLLNHYDGREIKIIESGMHIHHIDGDHNNNNIDNLMVVDSSTHTKLHAESDGHAHKSQNVWVKVSSIKRNYGNSKTGTSEQDVYDIGCVGNHNYFANGVLTHNCGKTTLAIRLSCGRYTFLEAGRSFDDAFVNVYSDNSLIALDDECSFSKNIDYEKWKRIVTMQKDTFSRKFQQPETHPRSFIIIRTSNITKTSYTVDERRQIIFESKLPKDCCRVWELPDEFFEQMFAEAKVYYEKYGVYQLTDADRVFMKKQQADSFHTENTYYIDALNYVNWVRNKIKSCVFDKPKCWLKSAEVSSGWAISWQTYSEWCSDTLTKPMNSLTFWNQIAAIAAKTGFVGSPSRTPLVIDGCPVKYAELFIDGNGTDKISSDVKVETTSVMGFFEVANKKPTHTTYDSGRSNAIANELGAIKVMKFPSLGMYKIPDELRWCPQAVREFFTERQGSNVISPTTIEVYGLPITYGLGGIHYAIKEFEGEDLMYVDVQSMYPNIMINYNLFSRAIAYKSKYVNWVRDREKAKKEGDKLKDAELKLKVNSVYGLMKADWCPLYDPYMASSISVMGQVLMTILIGGLVSAGCEIINANTDGLIIRPNGGWHNICEQWEKNTGLKLSYKPIKHLEQANVNNYRATMPDGSVVNKGEKFNKTP